MQNISLTRNEKGALNVLIGNLSKFSPSEVEWIDGTLYAGSVTFDPEIEEVFEFIRDAIRYADNGQWLAACMEIIRCGKVRE